MYTRFSSVVVLLALSFLPSLIGAEPGGATRLDTVAEKSNYTATSRHTDVLAFCDQLAKISPLVRQAEMGVTQEGRKLPLLILADPPVSTPEEAKKSGKLVVFAMGNIHAGEVDGKEALMMLARDLALAKDRPLLKDLVILIAPNFNADGGDKLGKNRTWQAGPPEVGTRENASGFDLNRDFVKLETPEVQALVRLFRRWDPAIFIDCHTTNGTYHRYTLTYDGPRHPSNSQALTSFVSDTMLPDVGKRLEKASGFKSFYYGNLTQKQTQWEPTLGQPRYGTHYMGFRNRIGILSESYVYAPYRDRVQVSKEFVRACFEYAATNKTRIRALLDSADRANKVVALPAGVTVPLKHKLVKANDQATILALEGGKTTDTGKPRDIKVDLFIRTESTLSVGRPWAYLVPASFPKAIENLQRHGVELEELREDVELDVEAYRVDKISSAKPFQKHNMVSLETNVRKESRRIPAGTMLVRTAQNLGNLASFLLEPQSEDGLVTWNFFDAGLKQGSDYPVLRVPAHLQLVTTKARPLAEDRGTKKLITVEMMDNGTLPNLIGEPVSDLEWLPDGEHYLQTKNGHLLKVHAATGRAVPYRASTSKLREVSIDDEEAGPRADAQGKGKGGGDLRTTSPTKKHNAFVRGNNLYVEDATTKKETALTKDGSDLVFNGKADWVYYEEVWNRKYQSYWWSPDGEQIAFLRIDDAPVPKATVIDYTKPTQLLEVTNYPRAGEPNPLVKLGIGSVAGEVKWADLGDYAKETGFIITKVGWLPDSKKAWFCVQNRTQTWLDFCTVGLEGGKPTKVFRDTTKAWVDPPISPIYLEDGSFLTSSERTGWKHVYHYEKDGKLKGQVTKGDWDVRSVQRFDKDGGHVYFSGTKDSLTATNAYRIKLDGTGIERIGKGKGKGTESVSFSPKGHLFISTYSDADSPPQVNLYKSDGTLVRVLDSNPVYVREEFQMGEFKRMQIPTPDGFLLEASVTKPANFDATKKYPVWFMTYGGPHAPSVRDAAGKGGAGDQALANAGYIVFRADPRSASAKGAISTWTCYKQLGVQELKDIEVCIKWLTAHPWADASRVGMSGHSYGGFMTAFCLINSKLFKCGIAGAPPTDWHNYDSIYTERYMQTPKENPKGYADTSLLKKAGNITGRLLLTHGLKDDNVHVQNTIQLMNALQQANKEFEVMLYPLARHGIGGAHYTTLQREFMKRNLQPEK